MQPRAGQAVTMIVFGQTKRREFLGVLGGATVAWLCAARTQQPAMSVIGFSAARHPFRSRPTWRRSVEGWTTIIVLILMLGGLQLCVLGILGEYLWRVCDEVRRRPLFLVQDVVGSFPRHEHSLQGVRHNEVASRLLTDSGA